MGVWASAQEMESAMGDLVADGVLSAEEALAVEAHIESSGWPSSKEEVAAIAGLSIRSATALMADQRWRRWVFSQQEVNVRSRLQLDWDVDWVHGRQPLDSVVGPAYGTGLKIYRSAHWGLRLDRGAGEKGCDHVGGFVVLPRLRGVEAILGDHVIRWGQGLVGWNASPFDGLRSATSVQQVTQSVRPILSGDALHVRRGMAFRVPLQGREFVFSLDAGQREVLLSEGQPVTWYRDGQHRTWAECNRAVVRPLRLAAAMKTKTQRGAWGIAAESGRIIGRSSEWSGFGGIHFERDYPRSRFAGEWIMTPGSWAGLLGWIIPWTKHIDGFIQFRQSPANHPALGWGELRGTNDRQFMWGMEAQGLKWDHFLRWNWNPEELEWEGLSRFKLNRQTQAMARVQGAEGLQNLLLEFKRDEELWGVKVWAHFTFPKGQAWGVLWFLQSASGHWKWNAGCSMGELPTGQLIHRLEPNARSWQTTVLTGISERWWMKIRWKVNPHWKLAASVAVLHRADAWKLPDSGPWRFDSNNRCDLRMRVSYAL